MTALTIYASSPQRLDQYRVKTTLAFIIPLIPSSAAHRQTTILLSGGLEPILKISFRKIKQISQRRSLVKMKGTCRLYRLQCAFINKQNVFSISFVDSNKEL